MRGVTVTVSESMLESTSMAMRGRPRPRSKVMMTTMSRQCMAGGNPPTSTPTPIFTPTRLLTLERQSRRRRRRRRWPSSLSSRNFSPIVSVSDYGIPWNLIGTGIDVGNTNGNGNSISPVGGYHLTTIRSASMSTRTGSDHEREGEAKRARMEYERMKNSASRILASRDLLDLLEKDADVHVDLDEVNVSADEKQHKQLSAVRNEVTVALQYWSHPSKRRRLLRIMDKGKHNTKHNNNDDNVYKEDNWIDNEEEFTQRGEQLLDWILNSNRTSPSSSSLLRIDPDEAVLANLMESHLLPTAVGTAGITAPNPTNHNTNSMSNANSNSNSNSNPNPDPNASANITTSITHRTNLQTWSRAIYRAARVWDKWNAAGNDLREGYAGPTTTAIGCVAALHLWSRICTLASSSQSQSHSESALDDWEYWRSIGSKEPSLLEMESSLEMSHPIPSSLRVSSVVEVVDQMETLLADMEAWSDLYSNFKGVPDEYAYNTVIGTLASCSSVHFPNAPRRAEWYLRRMERTEDEDLGCNYNESKDEKEDLPRTAVYADTITYNSVLKAYASSSSSSSRDSIPSCTHAHTILQRMKHRYETTKRPNVQPDTISYSTVLHGYANAGRAKEAERVLDDIVTLSRQTGWEGRVRPNLICVNSVIDAWAKSSGADLENAAVRAHAILDRMEELAAMEWFDHNHDPSTSQNHHDTKHHGGMEDTLLPDTISYSSVISAYARSKREDGAQTAEALLRKSLELYETGTRPNLRPDSVTFNSVLDAWAKHKYNHHKRNHGRGSSSIAETRAEALLEQMHRLEREGGGGSSTVRPCTISYNILLDLYAKIPKPEKATALLDKMHDLYQKEGGAGVVKPDLISYNSVLYAWASSTHDGALDKAEGLIRDMEGFCHNHGSTSDATSQIRPDIVSYNTVMGAIVKHAERDRSANVNDKRDAAERAEELLRSVEERYRRGESDARPNSVSYNICIDAWSKCGGKEAAQRAERILARMMDDHDGEDDREGNGGENDNVRPDTVSFTSVIDAISKSGETNAAHRAEILLQQMEHQPNAVPNRITFNSVINCWARSGERGSARKAEEILLRMEELSRSGGRPDVRPDSVTFSSVINALARSGEKGAAERAESILRRMEELEQAGDSDVKANRYAYGAVVNAWARSGERDAPERAVGVLQRMEGLYQDGNQEARPNQHIYNAVINTFAKSKRPSKAREAHSIFLRMMESYRNGNADAKPSVLTYSTLLNACAYTRGTSEDRAAAFQIARSCMKDLLGGSGESPNNIVFGTFLLACSNLLPPSPERDRWIASAFRECIRLGVVDTKVVLNVRRSASPDLVRTLLDGTGLAEQGSSVSFESLPEDWRCNVRSHRAPSRQKV